MFPKLVRSLPICLVFLMALTACSNSQSNLPVPTPSDPEPTPAPRQVVLPDDEGAHEDRLEWWYYNGHLIAESGEEFGFHFVIFQTRDSGFPAYAAQFSITDVAAQSHVLDSRLYVGRAAQGSGDDFQLVIRDWNLEITDEGHRFNASSPTGEALALTFKRDLGQPVMTHGQDGWIGGATGWTYYYSWPDMPASGTLSIGGVTYEVTGTGWFDHQWGDFFVLGAPGGWQWFALHLGDGETLMITEARLPDGSIEALYGTWRDRNGVQRHLTSEPDGISLTPIEYWTSPNTGGEYPTKWRLEVDGLNLDVEIASVVADQEITEGVPQAAIYWEGKVSVTGSYRGDSIDQPGYVELTGYVEPAAIPWRETAD